MMMKCRRKHSHYACLCCVFLSIVVMTVWYHTDRFLSVYVQDSNPNDVAAAQNAERRLGINSDRHKYEKLTFKAKDAIKTVFNLGELIRNEQMTDAEQDEILSPPEIEHLKKLNLCPKAYILSDSFVKEHENITHVSNWTIAQDIKDAMDNGVNATLIEHLLKALPRIVIMTPVSNVANNLQHYFKLLCSLSYPHERISIAIGEDSSNDRSYELAHVHSRTLKQYFNRVEVFHFDDELTMSRFGKHDEFFQFERRSHLARARNQLLFHGLRDEDYVLWVDCDVKYMPTDIIQHLISADKDVIVPSCMFQKKDGSLEVYDRNSWRETARSLEFLTKKRSDFLKLEGYRVSMRNILPEIQNEGHLVALDGVGGCVLMVKAQCHRKGLIFPPFIFQNHIETEGLAKMANTMGFSVYGYPKTYVCHW